MKSIVLSWWVFLAFFISLPLKMENKSYDEKIILLWDEICHKRSTFDVSWRKAMIETSNHLFMISNILGFLLYKKTVGNRPWNQFLLN